MSRTARPWYRKDRKAWFVTIAGVRHNLGADKAEAFRQFHSMMQRMPERGTVRQSFVCLADAFLDWLHKHRATDTYEWYRYRVERFCQANPELMATDLKPMHVQRWVDGYTTLSKTSKRNYIRAIKRCAAWACKQGYLESNPIVSMEMPAGERREVFVSASDFQEILSYLTEETFRELCQVTFETGCRPQESLIVEARHFDAARSRWVFPVRESKGKRQPRVVYLSPFAEQLTRTLIAKYPEGPIFRNRMGRPWTTDAVNCAFSRLRTRMGTHRMKAQGIALDEAITSELQRRGDKRSLDELTAAERRRIGNCAKAHFAPKYCLYSLRHGFATGALQSGLDGLTVGILLGHNDPSTLARVYQHVAHNPEHLLGQLRKTLK